MNYQQVIADAIKQTIFQTVDVAATTTGSGSSFCFSSATTAAAAVQWVCLTVAADAATTMDAAIGSGLSFCFPAVAVSTPTAAVDVAADANLIPRNKLKRVRFCEPSIQKLFKNTSFLCNILLFCNIYIIDYHIYQMGNVQNFQKNYEQEWEV